MMWLEDTISDGRRSYQRENAAEIAIDRNLAIKLGQLSYSKDKGDSGRESLQDVSGYGEGYPELS